MMSDKDIEEYHNIGRKIPKSDRSIPMSMRQGPRNMDHGSMM